MSTVTSLPRHQPVADEKHHTPPQAMPARDVFHASPELLEPGTVLVPGAVCERRTTFASTGQRVSLAATVEDARAWARYIGQRCDADRVGIYRARANATPVGRVVGSRPGPELVADRAAVVELLEWVDPWAGCRQGYRQERREIPF